MPEFTSSPYQSAPRAQGAETKPTTPVEIFIPATESELCRWLADNYVQRQARVRPVGGRTALHFGYPTPVPLVEIELSGLHRVIDYPARDLTITVEAGMKVAELQALLAQEGQQLPIDIAEPTRATVGGAVATATFGPRRYGYGSFRDYVIGIAAVDSRGRLFHAGGRVVKNVAGYDLCKLLTGSRGTLGVISQVTFKLRPLPLERAAWWVPVSDLTQVDRLLERAVFTETRPVALEVMNRQAALQVLHDARYECPVNAWQLFVLFEGAPREVAWQLEKLSEEWGLSGATCEKLTSENATALLTALTEFPVYSGEPLIWQANVRPSLQVGLLRLADQRDMAVVAHAGNGLIWGEFPCEMSCGTHGYAVWHELQQVAREAGGNLIVLHGEPEWLARLACCGLSEPAWPWMKRLKSQLDPAGLLNPGLFLDGGEG
ncbi:MAG: FAD-linked oxidase [Planctomycetaceae bacterium]|nr:MAG: FAD-linked oxidase [Planctomycetaceae bacterium]